jgi:outer membrane lipoprotein SlyB
MPIGQASSIGTNVMPISQAPVAQAPASSGVGNLESELATIQALRASAPSGGIGESLGGAAGGGIGAAFGGPVGATVGAGAGKAIGGVVDYMINSKAQKRAEAKELKARRALIQKEKMKANARAVSANKNRLKGIRASIEEEGISERDRLVQERQMQLDNMMASLQNKAQNNQFLQNKFLASRSI